MWFLRWILRPLHPGKQVPVLLSSLSLNLFCCFLTCFSHPHPLGIKQHTSTHAYACTDAPANTHSCAQTWHGKTHMLPADVLVRTLISVVVTSEGCYSTARHLDTHGILHYCVSKSTSVCVRVCACVCVCVREGVLCAR